MSIRNPSITYFITTTGRETLKDTLRSLYGQFAFGLDKVCIFFDKEPDEGMQFFSEEFLMFGIDLETTIMFEPLGYWGHALRNKFQSSFTTDYVHHMDDDDIYCTGVVPTIRDVLKRNYGKVIICKFRTLGKRIIWESKRLEFGQVGTPSGLIFNRPEIFGTWGYEYGGDFQFYKQLQDNIGKENLVFDETVIVKTRPREYGY